jgi:hypothetical protein
MRQAETIIKRPVSRSDAFFIGTFYHRMMVAGESLLTERYRSSHTSHISGSVRDKSRKLKVFRNLVLPKLIESGELRMENCLEGK